MASNLQSFGYMQRSSELIDIRNLPVTDFSADAARRNNATPTTANDVISVRQIDFNKTSSSPSGARVSLGNAKLQRRTSSKMQRPLAYVATQPVVEAFRTRTDSTSSASRSKSDAGLLRMRKRSTEQPPPTPGSRSSTFISQVSLNLNSGSALLRRKPSMGGADARLDTPQNERERASAAVRRHTSLSPRTLRQTRQHVTQRLVVERDNSDLVVVSTNNPTHWPSSESIVVSGTQAEHEEVPHWTDSSATASAQKDQPADVSTPTNETLSQLRLSMADFPSPHVDSPSAGPRRRPELCVAQKTLHRWRELLAHFVGIFFSCLFAVSLLVERA